MTPSTAPCPALGIEVAVASIDLELRKLWEQDEARTNASLMNLVVYSERPGSLVENSGIIRELTREHACRAILVEVDPRASQPGLRAWITAHCHLAHGRKSVCCEQIAFHLIGKVTGRFRNTVFAHLNADLPLVLWWQGELSDLLTERMASTIDRLIVDSSGWAAPAVSFARIAEAARANPSLVLHDLEWTRTWQFRLGVASIFDEPGARKALPDIDTIEIDHHPAHRNAALMMLAWLATQAGWQDDPDSAQALRHPDGRPIRVTLNATPQSPPLARLTLHSGTCIASLHQSGTSPRIERRLEAPGYQVASYAPADPTAPGDLIALQLARGGRNSLFHKILPRFLKVLDAGGSLQSSTPSSTLDGSGTTDGIA